MRRWVGLVVLLWSGGAFGQQQPALQALLQQLQSPEDAVRLQAMEKAPAWGASLIPHLPALLTHSDWRVQRAASIVLETIAARATRATPKERRDTIGALLALTKPTQPLPVRRIALQMMGICGTDEFVPSLAALLSDEAVRQEALNALKQIGSAAAARAIASAAPNAQGEWLRALLATLGEIGRPEGVPLLLAVLKGGDAVTKAVAAEALGRIPDARGVAALVEAVGQGVPTAFDALIRTGEGLLRQNQTSQAFTAFEQAYRLARTEHQRCAALLGLGKTNLAKALLPLVDALEAPEPTVRAAALEALTAYRHPDASRGLREMWRQSNPSRRAMLLRVFVARGEPEAAQLLRQAAHQPHPMLSSTALELMGEVDDPAVETTLWEMATKGDEATRRLALSSYLHLAARRTRKGKTEQARTMWERALQLAEQSFWTDLRDRALEGLALVGDPRSLPVVERYLRQPNPPRPAFIAAVAIADTLEQQGQKTAAEQLALRLLATQPPRDVIRQAAQLLVRLGKDPAALAQAQGFLVRWWVLGPLPNPNNSAFDRPFLEETTTNPLALETVRVDGRTLRWREIRTADPQGVVDLREVFRQNEWVACYAYTEFVVDREVDAELRVGSDDSVKVWLNGQLVHQFGGMRGLTVDQDRVAVRLKEGINRLLLKVTQGEGGWEFCVRLTDRQGNPLPYREAR